MCVVRNQGGMFGCVWDKVAFFRRYAAAEVLTNQIAPPSPLKASQPLPETEQAGDTRTEKEKRAGHGGSFTSGTPGQCTRYAHIQ